MYSQEHFQSLLSVAQQIGKVCDASNPGGWQAGWVGAGRVGGCASAVSAAAGRAMCRLCHNGHCCSLEISACTPPAVVTCLPVNPPLQRSPAPAPAPCPPSSPAAVDATCCTRQSDLLEAGALLADAFDLARSGDERAVQANLTAVRVLEAVESSVLSAGDPDSGELSRLAGCGALSPSATEPHS